MSLLVVKVALRPSSDAAAGGSSEVGTMEKTFKMPEYSGVIS